MEVLKLFNKLLRAYGKLEAECIGNRYNAGQGKGLEFSVDYKITGNFQYFFLKMLANKLVQKGLNVSNIKKC